MINNIKICTRCILPETIPGIRFDDQGVCKYCLQEENNQTDRGEKKEEYGMRFEALVSEIKEKAPIYDVLMAYSGGKDSSYTLKLLREKYDLRVLALTFDNHFVSPSAFDNIATITNQLDVDSMVIRPPWSVIKSLFSLTAREDIFSKTSLLRASSICTGCIGIVKGLVLKTALEMQIPLVAFGWSPGQAPIQSAIMKTNPTMTLQAQKALIKSFPEWLQEKIRPYYVPESYFEIYADRFPQNIHPLAFFEYNEEKIKEDLSGMGWNDPSDTDTNSSNCLINAFANQCHLDRHGFHPYAWEIANMVRQGIIDREDGMDKIYTEQNPYWVEFARQKLES